MEVINVENLYKQYRLGQVSTGSIAHDFNRWWHKMQGKEDPYEKITGENNREVSGSKDYVWALQDINFSVKQGEVLGIIGRNGAGKSTLLKILSKVTSPTKGNIKVKGRIASLLEVGTGFHPELTGRENIFLNGAILGMTKAEIRSKFDEIVAFSGVEKYIDTPVKRYSSGMYVRLAFAVAAHLEPEILIVDEVLAVGDAEFQKKCLGKMKDVSGEGRTVLFVSHNMGAIASLCPNSLLLNKGKIEYSGLTEICVNKYLNLDDFQNNPILQEVFLDTFSDELLRFFNFEYEQSEKTNPKTLRPDQEIAIRIKYGLKKQCYGFRIGFDLFNESSQSIVFRSFHDELDDKIIQLDADTYETTFIIPKDLLKPDYYSIKLISGVHNKRWIINGDLTLSFEIINAGKLNSLYSDYRPGFIMPKIQINTSKIKIC